MSMGLHGGKDLLLITPPLVQPNTAYPATPQLTGFLRSKGWCVEQADASLDLLLDIFSRKGMCAVRKELLQSPSPTESVRHFLLHSERYIDTVDAVIRFLQGRDPTLAERLVRRELLPEGPRFGSVEAAANDTTGGQTGSPTYGPLGIQDYARHLASLYIDDLTDVVHDGVDPAFALSRYAERLVSSMPVFLPVKAVLEGQANTVTKSIDAITDRLLREHSPSVVGFTVPFPGNLVGALRMARRVKRTHPDVWVVMGGGYVSTELRSLQDEAFFEYVDFAILDDGELPLHRLLEHRRSRRQGRLVRTLARGKGGVVLLDDPRARDVPHSRKGTPTWDGLRKGEYLSLCEMSNPMHRLWSNGQWNKLALAHGCYWRRCRFCDTSLDYIRRYDPAPVEVILRRMESLVRETGQTGFHFVDEAASPALLRRLADAIVDRGFVATWWANIRFESAFDAACVGRLRQAGCIAVSGGLETVCDRTLSLMDKGIAVVDSVRVMARLANAGIMVHAYLMYGFPGQTLRETVDALEIVRQLFKAGLLHSAYWHRFALTVHSRMATDAAAHGVMIQPVHRVAFAQNEVPFIDEAGSVTEEVGEGLHRAVYNYMHGVGWDADVREWFMIPVPRSSVGRTWLSRMV
jgi:radical SAM superfamily enzyme YgiQ (UPF0313 family)